MNKITLIIYVVIVLSSLSSCSKISEEDTDWLLQSQPVVFCVISPLTTVQVNLSKTIVANEVNDSIYYPTAKVYLCGEDKHWVELSRKSYQEAVYLDTKKELVVKEGQTYYLRVEIAGKAIGAQTTVPRQMSKIIQANFVKDKEQYPASHLYGGAIQIKLQLYKNEPCILTSVRGLIGSDYSTFLQQDNISERLHIPDSLSTFNLSLITLDSFLSKYWVAKRIESNQHFYEGDVSIIFAKFGGLLPQYSNIDNGIGLFGSYAISAKTITVSQP